MGSFMRARSATTVRFIWTIRRFLTQPSSLNDLDPPTDPRTGSHDHIAGVFGLDVADDANADGLQSCVAPDGSYL